MTAESIRTHIKWARHYNRKAMAEVFRDARESAMSMRRYHMSKARILKSHGTAREQFGRLLSVDPTPWCHVCGAMKKDKCKCGPIADND
jgi:Mg2+ and Co2+ transporter CorA